MSQPPELNFNINKKPSSIVGKRLKRKFQALDSFGEGYHMNLDQGSTQLNSWMGSICSIFLICIVLAYVV